MTPPREVVLDLDTILLRICPGDETFWHCHSKLNYLYFSELIVSSVAWTCDHPVLYPVHPSVHRCLSSAVRFWDCLWLEQLSALRYMCIFLECEKEKGLSKRVLNGTYLSSITGKCLLLTYSLVGVVLFLCSTTSNVIFHLSCLTDPRGIYFYLLHTCVFCDLETMFWLCLCQMMIDYQ